MVFLVGLGGMALADSPAAGLFGNTLLCREAVTGAACALWFNPDGRYAVFYDSGKPAFVTGVGGAFRYEGREGRYTARFNKDGVSICVSPDVLAPPARFSRSPRLFRDAGCVDVPRLRPGQVTTLQYLDHEYRIGLVRGR